MLGNVRQECPADAKGIRDKIKGIKATIYTTVDKSETCQPCLPVVRVLHRRYSG